MCHWSPYVSYEACYEYISMMSEGPGGVKKCFLGLQLTALLLPEGKKQLLFSNTSPDGKTIAD
jgi:hypothetical protein